MKLFTGKEFWELFSSLAADIYPKRYTQENCYQLAEMANEAVELIKEKDILLLVHNYQLPEIQEVGRAVGYIGDSLGLTLKAKGSEQKTLLYATVEFMAKTGKILLQNRRILIPTRPGCSLVESVDLDTIKQWKRDNPNGKIISYINTDDETKALSDYICTSRNAGKIVARVKEIYPEAKILFLPDKFLAANAIMEAGINPTDLDIWPGYCHVHKEITSDKIDDALNEHPDAELLVHPECGCTSSCLALAIRIDGKEVDFLSTEGMINRAKESEAREFIVATEKGLVYRLRRDIPEKIFYAVSVDAECEYMKEITLENLLECLRNDKNPQYEVKVNPEIAKKAYAAIQRMMEMT